MDAVSFEKYSSQRSDRGGGWDQPGRSHPDVRRHCFEEHQRTREVRTHDRAQKHAIIHC